MGDRVKLIKAAACHDCGGRCPYVLHVENGRVVRMEPRDDALAEDLRPCVRVYAYAKKLYAPDRLQFPLRRVGERGEGRFERTSWDEAFRTVAAEFIRVRDQYGLESLVFVRGGGSSGYLHFTAAAFRLINKFGGCTTHWGGPSAESSVFSSRVTYGTLETQHTRNDIVNARLIILWGQNPAVTIQGTDTTYWLVKAKEAGARIVVIDPRFTPSAATWADKWLPVRGGTDTALALAMAHTMISEGIHDQAFLDRYTVGFPEFARYVLGEDDGTAKTAEWAAEITGLPAEAIRQLARDYATMRPATLMPAFAPGRTKHGAQFHRAVSVLAAMTGNIGINGGNPAAFDRPLVVSAWPNHIPTGKNPTERGAPSLKGMTDDAKRNARQMHFTKIWDAILRGKEGGYRADFKAAYFVQMNALNQLPNVKKGEEALRKLDFVLVQDHFMTPTAKFADIIFPATMHWERSDIFRPWNSGSYYLYSNRAVEPMYECKSEMDIARELAPYLGVNDYGDLGDDEWHRELVAKHAEDSRYITDFDSFQHEGVIRSVHEEPVIPFREQIADPEHHPFPTPSGKIEIYSATLAEQGDPDNPPIPTFFPEDVARDERYPLRMVTSHSLVRAHSIWHNIGWLRELHPQAVLVNSADAAARGIKDGDQVLVFNDLGKVLLPAKVTERIVPGLVDIPEGAWYDPDEVGIDRGGCSNTLTPDRYAPGGGFVYNGIPVEVRASDTPPPPWAREGAPRPPGG